ncbi:MULTISPECIES: YceG family protein [unclassified Fusibacter]|uniref:YceG family protein n=1 Tax=unclassified Fusibacter TaxID=2624464 RepID=UPI0010125E0E|nr:MULTISPECIES: YceG family protein [unclassified Fusibacter]MCK8058629.1 YceG family protein [Fusibacter sp. A2]NPE21704.1 hypothetical protein [Fusibacter sp. A1]RXV61279.1 hypothetical protein DWB64_07655 [Fusibacter sp. A1]
MKTHTTTAHQAEQELNALLGHENRIYKPWQLENHVLEPVRLKATTDEMLMLTYANAYVRPHFEVDEKRVTVPNLVCKLNGAIHGFVLDMKVKEKQHPNLITIYYDFGKMNKKPKAGHLNKKPKWFDEMLGINVDQALQADLSGIKHLKPAYQRTYLEAINRVLKIVKSSAYKGEAPSNREVLETLLFNSRKIGDMFHAFDYQYMVPKFLVVDKQKKPASPYAAIRLIMMSVLGFDVFIASEDAYSSIENYVTEDVIDIHYLTEREFAYSEVLTIRKKRVKMLLWTALAAIVLSFIFFALKIY